MELTEGTPLTGSAAPTQRVGCFETSELRGLWFALIAIFCFSVATLVAALESGSLQLMLDALAQFIDASTYAINIVAAFRKTNTWKYVAVCWSLIALFAVNI